VCSRQLFHEKLAPRWYRVPCLFAIKFHWRVWHSFATAVVFGFGVEQGSERSSLKTASSGLVEKKRRASRPSEQRRRQRLEIYPGTRIELSRARKHTCTCRSRLPTHSSRGIIQTVCFSLSPASSCSLAISHISDRTTRFRKERERRAGMNVAMAPFLLGNASPSPYRSNAPESSHYGVFQNRTVCTRACNNTSRRMYVHFWYTCKGRPHHP